MNPLLGCAILGTSLAAVAMLWIMLAARDPEALAQRVLEVTRAPVAQPKLRPAEKLSRLFDLTHWIRARLGIASDGSLQERLARAGCQGARATDLYVAARLLGPALAVAAAVVSPFAQLSMILVLPGFAFLLPDFVLKRLTARRRERIRLSVPDAVDLMVICVDAGLGLDQAMLRVAQELGPTHPEISQEFLQMNREQRAGKLRLEAWQGMAARCELSDVDAMVNMLLQSERFGTPIARALRQFSEGIRLRRRQRAEEMAAKTTVKIIFPLVLFIFPTLFIVLLAPAAISIMRGLSGTFQ